MGQFQFKKFVVKDGSSAMKVGTDGVLLGCWMTILPSDKRMLDIGTGCGVISLIAAQRCELIASQNDEHLTIQNRDHFATDVKIFGVDIDIPSATDAYANFTKSPWSDRLVSVASSIEEFRAEYNGEPFDLIFTNPPYFNNSLKAPETRRSDARHTDSLSYSEILLSLDQLLAPNGRAAIVLPNVEAELFIELALSKGYHLNRLCKVHTTTRKTAGRYLMEFSREEPIDYIEEHLYIQDENDFTPQYKELTKEFYLKW